MAIIYMKGYDDMGFGGLLGKSATTYTDQEILSDSVKSTLGLSSEAVPSDAFEMLYNNIGNVNTIVGSYIGNFVNQSIYFQKIELGVRPKIVFIINPRGTIGLGWLIIDCDLQENWPDEYNMNIPIRGTAIQFSVNTKQYLATYSTGFVVTDNANSKNQTYYYSALI